MRGSHPQSQVRPYDPVTTRNNQLINMIFNAAIRGATAGAAATWVNQKMQPARTTPIWTDQIGTVTLTLLQATHGTRTCYQLCAISAGAWLQVGMYGLYPEALAGVQSWQEYLRRGGTVEAWVRQSLPQKETGELR
jgi:hypothetical protein